MGTAESKLALRQNVLKLTQTQNIPITDGDFWASFFVLPETSEDVFNFFTSKEVRKAITEFSENVETLLSLALINLSSITISEEFLKKEDITQISNSVRILTRFIPYIFEADPESNTAKVFKKFFEEKISIPPEINKKFDVKNNAELLILLVVGLLFLKGFTLPDVVSDIPGVHYIIWYQGIGSVSSPPDSAVINNNRTEVTRLLLTILSNQMYCTPGNVSKYENNWFYLLAFKTFLDKKMILAMLCSFLNTVIEYDPVGWVPYNHVLFADTKEQLVALSIQCLVALLDSSCGLATSTNDTTSPITPGGNISFAASHPLELNNKFRNYISRLHRTEDFELIFESICTLLENPMDSANTYLPGSKKKVDNFLEVLMLLWKLIESNEGFLKFIIESEKILIVVSSCFYFIFQARSEQKMVGLARICVYTIHLLSQERSFAVRLNKAFDHQAHPMCSKLVPLFTGNWADFFVLAIYILVTTTAKTSIGTLHEHFLIALSNVSPYLKQLAPITANKIVSLFGSLSNPAYLLSAENNQRLLFYIIEAMNSIIQYQMTGNSHLIYAVVMDSKKVLDLNNMTFQSAQEYIAKLKALKQAKQQSARNPNSAKSSSDDLIKSQSSLEKINELEENLENMQLSEKAKGKQTLKHDDSPPTPLYDAKGKFIPTELWFNYWKQRLPIGVMLLLIESLTPKIEKLCVENAINDDRIIIETLEDGTLVGLLPPPHQIFVRKFTFNESTRVWFLSFLWGSIFVKYNSAHALAEQARISPPIWAGTEVKLFHIKTF